MHIVARSVALGRAPLQRCSAVPLACRHPLAPTDARHTHRWSAACLQPRRGWPASWLGNTTAGAAAVRGARHLQQQQRAVHWTQEFLDGGDGKFNTSKYEEGEVRRSENALRRERWKRFAAGKEAEHERASPSASASAAAGSLSLSESQGGAVSVVCHGNIARSQVLGHYLAHGAAAMLLPLHVQSCGTAPEHAYPGWHPLLEETQRRLAERTAAPLPAPLLERNWWEASVGEALCGAEVVLAADSEVRDALLARLAPPGGNLVPARVLLFYEAAGEGARDFIDTFDHDGGSGQQDQLRYEACFDELERLSLLICTRLQAAALAPDDERPVHEVLRAR